MRHICWQLRIISGIATLSLGSRLACGPRSTAQSNFRYDLLLSDLVRNLTNRSNVIVRGGVEDLSPYYREVAVVPIRASGGTRIKLLEAAIYAVPIVTTSCGAAGMAFRAGTEVLIANQEAAFAKSCLLLLTNRQSALRMAAQARLRASEGLQSESVWPTPTFCAFLFERY
jgi:hypothetical protein